MIWAVVIVLLLAAGFWTVLRKKHMQNWFWAYLRQRWMPGRSKCQSGPVHIMFSFVDHFEPQWGRDISLEQERQRVDLWMRRYPELVKGHQDADGRPPQHTFFYPEEEYRFEHLDKLAWLCQQGFGEIEVHLHHDDDTAENLRQTLTDFASRLHEAHGALSPDPESGQLMYGFIHGNWTLDNSAPDGSLCGVNNELIVLRETGCYADFTFPSAPHCTQPSTINSIYYAKDDPTAPKSHDKGRAVTCGGKAWGDLLLVNGPLMLNWKVRKKGVFPQIENADIRAGMEPTPERVDLWVKANVHVTGQPNWRFIKIHTHGTQEKDAEVLLGKPAEQMFSYLESTYNDGQNYCLHYVNSREMYNIIKAAEAGKSGNPNDYRDFILPAPSYKTSLKP
ncbi:hypothetical protein HMF8227_01182 [Saliniradius amylolyticus]|uniref:Uncharacterized protein n=1 Tax=Saliniradius amylolyticus TaxID=2183582 RepID=A0A2S2E1Z4_9ALTE|nr:hypothetical protein [Saliniradius amylolyticus]AWL11663.1 hypothetical protein HMF8227_01182 [Saliniradius amylolyticus]